MTISQRLQVTGALLRFLLAVCVARCRWAWVSTLMAVDRGLWRAQDARMAHLGWEIERAGWLGLSRLYRHPDVTGALRAGAVRCAG